MDSLFSPLMQSTCSEPTLLRQPLLLWGWKAARKDAKGKQVLFFKPLLRAWKSPGSPARPQTLLILTPTCGWTSWSSLSPSRSPGRCPMPEAEAVPDATQLPCS